MKKMKNRTKALWAISLLGCALYQQAQAVPITGDLAFFGKAKASGNSTVGPSTTVTFTNPWHAIGGDGSYATVPFNTPVTFKSFTFTGDGVAAALSGPSAGGVHPLWTFTLAGPTTYSFDLLALTSGHTQSGGMAFTGTGIAHITGFDDTAGTWALSGTAASGFNFSFSSSTTSADVPDGGLSIALLGIALTGIEVVRRKLKAA